MPSLSLCFLQSDLFSFIKNPKARSTETKSATAPAYRIHLIPKMCQRMKKAGIRIIICLERDKKALILLFQIDWKKIQAGI